MKNKVAPESPHVDLISDQAMAVHQMRETARYIDEHGKAPDDLAEFLRHWSLVLSDAPRQCLKVFV